MSTRAYTWRVEAPGGTRNALTCRYEVAGLRNASVPIVRLPSALLCLLFVSCVGEITPPRDQGDPEVEITHETYRPFPGSLELLPRARVWQLTAPQYERTLEGAFGLELDLNTIKPTERYEGFLNHADKLTVNEPLFSELEELSYALIEKNEAVLAERLSTLGGCSVAQLDTVCLTKFLKAVAPGLFRVANPDVSIYLTLWATLRKQLDNRGSFIGVVAAMMLAPKTLFRTELGDPSVNDTGRIALTPSELAESLAYTLWAGPPDTELMRTAADGSLARPEVLALQVDRMLGSAKGRAGQREMLKEWLGLATFAGIEKNPNLFPQFDDALKAAMLQETDRLIEYVLEERGASLRELLTSQRFFAQGKAAALYTDAAAFSTQRRGVFTQPAVITAMSEASLTGVIFRGKAMLQRLLCRELKPPPDIDFSVLPPVDLNSTTRERLTTLESHPVCGTCHRDLHPMAFAMENYDPLGQFRLEENGKPIDASGSLKFTALTRAPFANAVEMLDLLADSPEVHQCFVRQTFRYVSGRNEGEGDDPLLHAAFDSFRGDQDMSRLLKHFVLSDSFRSRQRGAP